jgi:PAS domain S-box-containing protein
MDNIKTKESQYARSLIEASLDPLFTISPEGKITDINNASINITEITRENLIGTDFFEYFTEPDKAREIYKQVFAEGFVADFPLTIRDGKLTDVLFNGSVYKDEHGMVIGVVVVARDITDHKRIEKELVIAKERAELATKIAEEAQSKAEEATQIAQNAVISKQQFLSNMSHEIRTPMNSIIGFTKVMLKTELTDKQREYVTAIKMSGDVLTVLIDDILDLAKVDAGKMIFERKPFKMTASITAMIQLFEPKIQEKNIKLFKNYDGNIPLVLLGDPVRLHQILINLVSNSVKFTSAGSITIDVEMLHQDENEVIIEFKITDTGIGIAADKIEHIFENFQQATSDTSRLYGGTGLGLAIAKQLTEQQGGTITVKSILDKGTTCSVVMPFKKSNHELYSGPEIIEMDPEMKGIKVLVVEDIALNQLLMKTLLDDYGFDCDFAVNGKEAIEKLKKNTFDIVLMDLQMPEMNGFEASEYIRYHLNSHIPIIALTADVTTADLRKCKAAGMNSYISKPVDEKLLYAKIIELLKKQIPDIEPFSSKCTDLTYLRTRTKANPELMKEMILLYLDQTPMLVGIMKQGLKDKDWDSIHNAAHKMIPSFSIMGIAPEFENLGKMIQEYSGTLEHLTEIPELVFRLENICLQACNELTGEYNSLNNFKK